MEGAGTEYFCGLKSLKPASGVLEVTADSASFSCQNDFKLKHK